MSIDYYRRIWAMDMGNRTVDTAYNIYGNEKDWLEGWKEMQVPGRYEQDIFGDLMVPGIACGLRKMILIFNPFLSDFFRKKLFEIIIANAPL